MRTITHAYITLHKFNLGNKHWWTSISLALVAIQVHTLCLCLCLYSSGFASGGGWCTEFGIRDNIPNTGSLIPDGIRLIFFCGIRDIMLDIEKYEFLV